MMWIGTSRSGVSRYEMQEVFVNFTTKDGLGSNDVRAVHPDPRNRDGMIWFGTWGGGVSGYDGKGFVDLTTDDGLASNYISAIHHDADGALWFGMSSGTGVNARGVSRYGGSNGTDREKVVTFTRRDGLVYDYVNAIYSNPSDPNGVMWFGTGTPVINDLVGGVSRYDPSAERAGGKGFVNFTTEDGLVHNRVHAIHSDPSHPNGGMWFRTAGGVSRYAPATSPLTKGGSSGGFVNFTTKDGLPNDVIHAIYHDANGILWLGTDGGVSRYDGEQFINFTTDDGLAHNAVGAIYPDADGTLWFGTLGGGVCRYDGVAWGTLDARDGLAGNNVRGIYQSPDGYVWFATDGGVTRYRRTLTRPRVRILSVKMDREYTDLSAVPSKCLDEIKFILFSEMLRS